MIGRTISHFQILEKLGEGGMGVVYKARDTHLDRFVAIKVLPPERVADIITIHDIASEAGQDMMVMEYVAGKTLDELIPRKGMRLGEALNSPLTATKWLFPGTESSKTPTTSTF